MSERVYSLGRGPWEHKRVGFGVSQAAESPRFQPNDGGAAAGDEVTEHVHGVFPLPMGIKSEDRCE